MNAIDISLPEPRPGARPDLDDHLAQLESKRRRQLDQLPDDRLDPVAIAHRDSVERILEEVTTARRRLATGQYGVCLGCDESIDPERLEFRPWATRCTGCSRRSA